MVREAIGSTSWVGPSVCETQETPVVTLNPRRARRRHSLRLWTFDQAQAAVPYFSSIVRSLRERSIELQALRNTVSQIEQKPGRLDRRAIIALDHARKDHERAEQDYAS